MRFGIKHCRWIPGMSLIGFFPPDPFRSRLYHRCSLARETNLIERRNMGLLSCMLDLDIGVSFYQVHCSIISSPKQQVDYK